VAIAPGAVAAAAGLTFWGFLGLESGTVPADKVEDPKRNVPRATLYGVVLTGLVYLGISLAFALFMPMAQAAGSPAPVANFLGAHFGAGIGEVVALFAAISAFGALNGWILVQGEMPWAMARGSVFPHWFATESASGTPVRGHLLSSTLVSFMTLANYQKGMADLFGFIASVSLAAGLLAYLMSALAALRLLNGERRQMAAAVVAAAFTVWAEWGLGPQAIGYGALLVAIGLPFYWLIRTAAASA
jgi:APA family basic amino acid/polyamine antiporter